MKSSRLARGLVAAAVATCVAVGTAPAADAAGRGVPYSKISVQLWTFAEYIGFGTDPATIERTEEVFRRLSEMGYRNVEPFTLSGLSATEYRALLDEYGLKASARHVDVGRPEAPADIDQILADNKALGIKYFGSGSTPIFPLVYSTEAEWIPYAEYLNEVGERARKAGQTLMVHNHDVEFEETFNGRTVFDILAEHTEPKNVKFQLDLYWGGQRRRPGQPGRRARALRQADRPSPRQGHGAGAVPGSDRDRRARDHRLPGDLRRLARTSPLLRRRARSALRRPDVRPVRGRASRLRLPRQRGVLTCAQW